jgi:hypothetical protein
MEACVYQLVTNSCTAFAALLKYQFKCFSNSSSSVLIQTFPDFKFHHFNLLSMLVLEIEGYTAQRNCK